MKMGDQLNIPLRLGDAQQSDTLKSIKKLATFDIFKPQQVIQGAKSLAFSALGLNIDSFPDTPYQDSEYLQKSLEISNWVNIPQTYAENRSMIQSLLPIAIISMISTLIGYLPEVGQASDLSFVPALDSFASSLHVLSRQLPLPPSTAEFEPTLSASVTPVVVSTSDLATSTSAMVSSAVGTEIPSVVGNGISSATADSLFDQLLAAIGALLNYEPSAESQIEINAAADLFSFLLLIRMAKVIGSDRDRIIASKIQSACKEFSVSCNRCFYSFLGGGGGGVKFDL